MLHTSVGVPTGVGHQDLHFPSSVGFGENWVRFLLIIVLSYWFSDWRCGGSATLSSISDILSADEKIMLRNQNGGLQTFIRNNHQVFLARKGQVEIRKWPQHYKAFAAKVQSNMHMASDVHILQMRSPSKNPCWFFHNHPDGCPVADEECPYVH